MPYHLNTSQSGGGECARDPARDWGAQHDSWDGGAMDGWGRAHAGDVDWSFMGYYDRSDLPYYYAVADAFTLCDGYHCSAMGSTTGNRLYAMTGMLDPAGLYGGPVESTISFSPQDRGIFDPGWITYPEVLTDAGVPWKYYSTLDGDDEENPLVLFKQYYPGYSTDPALNLRAARLSAGLFRPSFENFLSDAAAGTLPPVSWVLTHITQMEHPSAAPQDGEAALEEMIEALVADPVAWSKTVVFFTYDENGGFFDHVVPADPAARYTRGVRRERGQGLRVGSDRARVSRTDARHLTVQPRWVRSARHLRPHLSAALPRDVADREGMGQRGGAQPVAVAPRGRRGPDRGAQLRAAGLVGATTAGERSDEPGRASRVRNQEVGCRRRRSRRRSRCRVGARVPGPRRAVAWPPAWLVGVVAGRGAEWGYATVPARVKIRYVPSRGYPTLHRRAGRRCHNALRRSPCSRVQRHHQAIA